MPCRRQQLSIEVLFNLGGMQRNSLLLSDQVLGQPSIKLIAADFQTCIGFLRLFLYTACIDSVKSEVTVVQRMAGEADRPLRTVTVIVGARNKKHQTGQLRPLTGIIGKDLSGGHRRAVKPNR